MVIEQISRRKTGVLRRCAYRGDIVFINHLHVDGLPDGDPDGLELLVLEGLSLGLAEIVPVPPDGLLLGLADGEADAVPVPPDGVALGLAETV